VIVNLLDNAVKHTPPGGTIHVSVRRDGEDALLAVEDTGAGMPADLLPRVFDLFTQGARGLDRTEGGLGIGLTLVRRLVELHHGRVEARSEGPGRGSQFTVRLPVLETEPTTEPSVETDASARRHRRVLVVEDNVDARDMLRALLEVAGHEVYESGDGLSALDAVARVKPDLALIDIGLPGMDGYELARRLRAEHPDIPLVAVTGYSQAEDRERSMRAGFARHLVKPVPPEQIDRVLADLT
jgi:two-component system, sensor histidine kinase